MGKGPLTGPPPSSTCLLFHLPIPQLVVSTAGGRRQESYSLGSLWSLLIKAILPAPTAASKCSLSEKSRWEGSLDTPKEHHIAQFADLRGVVASPPCCGQLQGTESREWSGSLIFHIVQLTREKLALTCHTKGWRRYSLLIPASLLLSEIWH